MAKRAAPDEKPYRPLLDVDLVSEVLSEAGPATSASSGHLVSRKVLEMPKMDFPRRAEVPQQSSDEDRRVRLADEERLAGGVAVLVEKFDQEKRVLFTRTEAVAVDRLVAALATRVNSQVKLS